MTALSSRRAGFRGIDYFGGSRPRCPPAARYDPFSADGIAFRSRHDSRRHTAGGGAIRTVPLASRNMTPRVILAAGRPGRRAAARHLAGYDQIPPVYCRLRFRYDSRRHTAGGRNRWCPPGPSAVAPEHRNVMLAPEPVIGPERQRSPEERRPSMTPRVIRAKGRLRWPDSGHIKVTVYGLAQRPRWRSRSSRPGRTPPPTPYGAMLWFSRKTLVGSQARLRALRRSSFASP